MIKAVVTDPGLDPGFAFATMISPIKRCKRGLLSIFEFISVVSVLVGVFTLGYMLGADHKKNDHNYVPTKVDRFSSLVD